MKLTDEEAPVRDTFDHQLGNWPGEGGHHTSRKKRNSDGNGKDKAENVTTVRLEY